MLSEPLAVCKHGYIGYKLYIFSCTNVIANNVRLTDIFFPLWPPFESRVHQMMQENENKCSSMLGLISFASHDDLGLCGAEPRHHCCLSHMIAQVHTKTQNHGPAFPPLPFLSLAFSLALFTAQPKTKIYKRNKSDL